MLMNDCKYLLEDFEQKKEVNKMFLEQNKRTKKYNR